MARGYHWCDNCDENTFAAATCPICQQAARFIPWPHPPATRPLSPPPSAPKISAAEWFRRMREAVANAKSLS